MVIISNLCPFIILEEVLFVFSVGLNALLIQDLIVNPTNLDFVVGITLSLVYVSPLTPLDTSWFELDDWSSLGMPGLLLTVLDMFLILVATQTEQE